MIKPWVIVAWDQYYPSASLRNIKGAYETKEEAEQASSILESQSYYDYIEIINIVDFLNDLWYNK